MLAIDRMDKGAVTVLRLRGDIDECGVEALRSALYDCLAEHRFNVVLNMRDVCYVSCMGIGVLVERLRKFQAFHGDMKLVGLNVYAERMFRMAGLSDMFDTYDTEARAVSMFRKAA